MADEKKRSRVEKKLGMLFPIGRLRKYLKKGKYAKRISAGAPVYLAGVLEYLAAELLEISGQTAYDSDRKCIRPRHLQLAIQDDEDFRILLQDVTISQGGVVPHIHQVLLPKPKMNVIAKREPVFEPVKEPKQPVAEPNTAE